MRVADTLQARNRRTRNTLILRNKRSDTEGFRYGMEIAGWRVMMNTPNVEEIDDALDNLLRDHYGPNATCSCVRRYRVVPDHNLCLGKVVVQVMRKIIVKRLEYITQ